MCECGCTSLNVAYKLPVKGDVFYLLQFYPGCRNCVAPPGIIIRRVGPHSDDYDYLKHLPELPKYPVDGGNEWTIRTGLDPDEFVKAILEQVKVGGWGNKQFYVEEAASDLANLVWDESINVAPEAVEAKPK